MEVHRHTLDHLCQMDTLFYRHQSSSDATCQAVGSRDFPVAGPKTWNALPEDVTSSQFANTFHCQLKNWLFKKPFPDVII